MKQVNCGQREFHLPYKAIIFENAEGTERQIVYDALVREDSNACLEGEKLSRKHCQLIYDDIANMKKSTKK